MTERVVPDGLIAVFAGTSEGRVLCERLSEAGRRAKAFVATEYGGELIDGLPGIDVNVGRLDAAAMTEALVDAALVIDATHPYAAEASANVRSASRAAGVECVRLVRPSLLDPDGEDADQAPAPSWACWASPSATPWWWAGCSTTPWAPSPGRC